MGLFVDILRAVADGFEKAAGQDPVDRHADEAIRFVNGNGSNVLDASELPTKVVGPIHWYPNGDDDPDVVELTGPIPDEETGLRLGIALRQLASLRQANAANIDLLRVYEREIARLNEQLAEKPYRIDTGERVLHVRQGEGVLVEAPNMTNAAAIRMREQMEDRFPGVRFGVFKSLGHIQIVTAAEQKVLDAVRVWARKLGSFSEMLGDEGRAVVDASRALDAAEDQR